MKRRKYLIGKKLNKSARFITRTSKSVAAENRILLKDILLPVLTATFVVLLQQVFFADNKRIETSIEFEMQRLKDQLPTLNRILLFSDNYTTQQFSLIVIPLKIMEVRNSQTGELISSEELILTEEADTLKMTLPTFITDNQKRVEFQQDLEAIKEEKGILDYNVYLEVEKVLEFLNQTPFPKLDDVTSQSNSTWNKKETIDNWHQLMEQLYASAYYKINSMATYY